MWNSRAISHLFTLLLVLHSVVALAYAQRSNRTTWKTLTGSAPLVIARGGFSGLFSDSSYPAYSLAVSTSVPDVIIWCDVQLTKDRVGICLPDINLDNATDIATTTLGNRNTSYLVNGVPTRGHFSVDYTWKDLASVSLIQGVYSRSTRFDGNLFPILTVEDVVKQVRPPGLWLNIQHDQFYKQHNLSMRTFVLSVYRRVVVSYISSTEVEFLRSMASRVNLRRTKLIFRFLGRDDMEPTTNQTYGLLLKNLTSIKTFASGILVPKNYIWPVDASLYLQPHTSLVLDAHKVGLEVFASDFTNDVPFSFNYSYDPIAEYLQFIDKDDFSVDGVLSDFPITASEAVGCFAQLGGNATKRVNTLVISKYGASGDYPACTDLAYQQAIADGVDVIDCPVQMSKDGVPFCLNSIDLIESTTVIQTTFSRLATTIPEIQSGSGIFSFKLTWDEIKNLPPSILNPYAKFTLFRNPKNKNSGGFLTLSDFLSLAKNHTSLHGVVIIIENAAYLAANEALSVTDKVLDALSKSGYDKPGTKKVMIQSTNSSVLMKFKENANYELVYKINENVGDAVESAVDDIKKFAHSVVVHKESIMPRSSFFLTGSTRIVSKLRSANLSVYAETFSNEFVSQAWDFFSDATVEINSYVSGTDINGVITDFPKTANRYTRNKCSNLGRRTPVYMEPVQPGSLLQAITPEYLPPAVAPFPPLSDSDVAESPLPVVANIAPNSSSTGGVSPRASSPVNAQPKVTACFILSIMAALGSSLLL